LLLVSGANCVQDFQFQRFVVLIVTEHSANPFSKQFFRDAARSDMVTDIFRFLAMITKLVS
jgi:hypothetical protein